MLWLRTWVVIVGRLSSRIVNGFHVDCRSAWYGSCRFAWCGKLYCTLVSFSFTLSLFSFSFLPLFLPFEVDLVSREEVINVSVLDICRWGGNCECTRRCMWECAFRCGSMCEGCCCWSGSLPLEYVDRHWEWLKMVVGESSEVVGDLLVLGRVCRGNAL
jgi:hypothetical protein